MHRLRPHGFRSRCLCRLLQRSFRRPLRSGLPCARIRMGQAFHELIEGPSGNPEVFHDQALLLPVPPVEPILARLDRDEAVPLCGIQRHARIIAPLGCQGRQGLQQLLGMCRQMPTRAEHRFDCKALLKPGDHCAPGPANRSATAIGKDGAGMLRTFS